ncbi:unnamed protein product, partial [Ixodes pacificus]
PSFQLWSSCPAQSPSHLAANGQIIHIGVGRAIFGLRTLWGSFFIAFNRQEPWPMTMATATKNGVGTTASATK